MTVLITGGAGFVGLNIAERLLARGDTVVALDLDLPPSAAREALLRLPGTLRFEQGDIRDAGSIADTLRQYQVTRIIHGAAMTAGLERERTQAAAIADVNLMGTLNVFAAACHARVARVVHLSSGAVFGAGGQGQPELREDRDVPEPESLYGITKYAAERAALRYRAMHGLDVVVARLGVVFGRWEYDTGVRDTLSIPLLLTRLAQARQEARFCADLPDDWLYASDAAGAVVALADAASLHHPLYQLGTGRRWSATTWCDRLSRVFPGFSYTVVGQRADANVGAHAPAARPPFCVERLRDDLGFTSRFDEALAFADYLAWRTDLHAGSTEDAMRF
jgi:nucleoside-diphosphate-sugar epimerase